MTTEIYENKFSRSDHTTVDLVDRLSLKGGSGVLGIAISSTGSGQGTILPIPGMTSTVAPTGRSRFLTVGFLFFAPCGRPLC